MILEVAVLDVRIGWETEFEESFSKAQKIISASKGYLGHQLQKCIETQSRYLLLVQWERLEDHTEEFRQSDSYQEWKKILHRFYDPFPLVQHYQVVYENK
jgi:heme-degrading monooxygenase HmoA